MSKNNLAINNFAPGSYGCHEALHMAYFLMRCVDEELVAHSAITGNIKWLKLAMRAETALRDLYQAIGEEHL